MACGQSVAEAEKMIDAKDAVLARWKEEAQVRVRRVKEWERPWCGRMARSGKGGGREGGEGDERPNHELG